MQQINRKKLRILNFDYTISKCYSLDKGVSTG